MFKVRDEPEFEPRLEAPIIQNGHMADVNTRIVSSATFGEAMLFSSLPTSRFLCKCGAIAEVDRSVLRTKKNLGKVCECRRCRNERIAREKEELDNEYFGQPQQ